MNVRFCNRLFCVAAFLVGSLTAMAADYHLAKTYEFGTPAGAGNISIT